MRIPATAALYALAALWIPSAPAVEPGDDAPFWTGMDFQGNAVAFPEVAEGHPALMIFWATWCPYCRAFMPYLEAIQADYADRGMKVIAVNAKERGRGDPKSYVEDLGFPVVAIRDGDAIAAAYGIEYIPGLLIIDADGKVVYRRPWTDLPAGRTVAELWDEQVRAALEDLFR